MGRFVIRSLIAALALLSQTGARADVENVSIVFSTRGPDAYKDGRRVLDGECYGLFWTPAGKAFAGIDADGRAIEPTKLALKAAVAKDGHCPKVLFQIDAGYAKANYPGGTWNVCLLDTRRFATDADGVVLKGADGLPVVASWGEGSTVVNGYGEADSAVVGTGVGSVGAAGAKPVARVQTASALPVGGENATVRDIKVVDGNVYLTVSGTSSALLYGLKTGETPSCLLHDGQLRYGKTGENLVIVTPMKGNGAFFSVGAKR